MAPQSSTTPGHNGCMETIRHRIGGEEKQIDESERELRERLTDALQLGGLSSIEGDMVLDPALG